MYPLLAELGCKHWRNPSTEGRQGVEIVVCVLCSHAPVYIRWRESESSRCQERLQQAERDAAVVLKSRLDALQESKTDEITRLQETHL